jgi:flagellar basal-body rod protein FlgC
MLFGALDAAASGATVSRVWMDAISDNVANINTITATNQEPFRARMVVANEVTRGVGQAGGVATVGIQLRQGDGEKVYDPTHPLADAQGYVVRPNVDLSVEMTNMLIANRSYQANIRVVETARDTYRSALKIGSH